VAWCVGVADGSHDTAQELGDLTGWLALGFPLGGELDVLGNAGPLTCRQAATTVGSLQDSETPSEVGGQRKPTHLGLVARDVVLDG
jgi:hypothetical protein